MRCRKPARTSKTKHRQRPAREDGGCDASRLTLRTLLFSGLIIRGVNGIMIWDKDLQRTELFSISVLIESNPRVDG